MTLTALKNNPQAIGILSAFVAYFIWGLQSAYWKVFSGLDAWVVIAHRYCWTTVALFLFIVLGRRWHEVVETTKEVFSHRTKLVIFLLASFFAVVNWWVNIFAPMHGHVVELGIGLFLTPLMSVMLGVLFFRERLNSVQKLSVILAIVGVALMLVEFGAFPWIALGVSSTWAIYGALKKKILLDPTVAIFLESIVVVPFALLYLSNVEGMSFASDLTGFDATAWALAGTGILTSVPLIAYTYATNYLPLNVLGFCQYLSPILTLCLGGFVYNEHFGWDELFPMSFIWLSIVLYLFGPRLHAKLRLKRVETL